MTRIEGPPLVLVSGGSNGELFERLVRELRAPTVQAEVGSFADGETRVRIDAPVRGDRVVIVQPITPPDNDSIMELALLADAARSAGAAEVVALVPYLGYARKDVRGAEGEPRSARVVARLLEEAGVERLVTVDLHAPALESAYTCEVRNLSPLLPFAASIRGWDLDDPLFVSPDAGGVNRARAYARAEGAETIAIVVKVRRGADRAVPEQVLGEVAGRNCVIVDDLVSTGRTLAGAARALADAGARSVHAAVTHPVMAEEAEGRLEESPLERILTSDSLPIPGDSPLEVVSLAPLLAQDLRAISGLPLAPRGGEGRDTVERAGADSFPASDPPTWSR